MADLDVSVVVPIYNRAHMLPRALASVQQQGFEALEIVVVDDGSTDDTAGLVDRLTEPRLRYIRFDRNRGVGAARGEGVTRSRAPLVAFLDSDDVWKAGKLANQVAILERHPEVDLVFSDYEDVDLGANVCERNLEAADQLLISLRKQLLVPGWWVIQEGLPEALLRHNLVGTSSVVLRRALIDRVGNFNSDLRGAEDLELWWRAAVLGARLAYTTQSLVEHHIHTGNITGARRAYTGLRLQALDVCESTARRVGRADLLSHINGARGRTWCYLVEACARKGDRRGALKAFGAGLRYGLSRHALGQLVRALAGPTAVDLARRVRSATKPNSDPLDGGEKQR